MVGVGFSLIINKFNDNLVYFYSPSDIKKIEQEDAKKFAKISAKKIRVGGLIKPGTLKKNNLNIEFVISDNTEEMLIKFTGIAPPMFREGQGVVAEGKLDVANSANNKTKNFLAENLITKHDEKYMPPEVHDALKK
jgi:cytochrome c-type biogenesis protein CcmE